MKKMFIIFSLVMMLIAGLFGGQILDAEARLIPTHEMSTGCDSGSCAMPVVNSCAGHCFTVVVQSQALPMISSPLFVYVMILSAIIALVAVEIKQSFYFKIFTIPLSRRLALNAVRRE